MKSVSLRLLVGAFVSAGVFQLSCGFQHPASAASGVSETGAAPAVPDAYSAGVLFLQQRRFKLAETQFRLAISRHQHLVQAYYGLADAAVALRDYLTAYHAFKNAARLAPKEAIIQYRTGYAALYAAYFHEAVHYATAYIKLRPRDWQGYHLRFVAEGNLLQAKPQVQDATAVVHLRPKDSSAWNDLGIALSQVRQYKAAINAESIAIRLDPLNPLYYMNRGVTENRDKQYRLALRDLKKARSLARDPETRKKLDVAIAYLQKHVRR